MRASLHSAALAAAVLLYVVIGGCTRREPDDPRRAAVDTYAQIVSATYEDSLAAARALDLAVDALLANPGKDSLDAARQRWKEARIPYGYSEAFRFYAGPIDAEGGPEGQLNGWPLDENHIDAVRAERYNAAPGANIIGERKSVSGDHAGAHRRTERGGRGKEHRERLSRHRVSVVGSGRQRPSGIGRRSARSKTMSSRATTRPAL